ncbi:unnamed protein product [Calypogeia fissa]
MAKECHICKCTFKNLQALKAHEQSIAHVLQVEEIARRERISALELSFSGLRVVSAQEAAELSQATETHHEAQEFGDVVQDVCLHDIGVLDQDGTPFDSTLQLANFIQNCRNRMGLSNHDVRALFGVLFTPKFNLSQVNVRTVKDLQRYKKSLIGSEGSGWRRHVLRQANATNPGLTLEYQNPLQVLAQLFSNKKNAEGFELHSKPLQIDEVQYTTPASGKWWKSMQSCPGGVIAPIILYSDQTSLSNNRQTQGYPLMMTIANIQCSLRGLVDGNALLAILPITSQDEAEETSKGSLPKIEILHQSLEVILSTLKAASYRGIPLEDPFGEKHWVFPLPFACICDHPKGCKVTCTYDTNKCSLPCSCCLCRKDRLSNVNQKFPYRTEDEMKRIYYEMVSSDLTIEEAKDKSQRWSLHPVYNALWDFNGGDTEMGNPYRLIHPDTLHMLDLGILNTIVDIIRDMALSEPALGPQVLRTLDKRLKIIRKDHRYSEFRLPVCSGSHKYFSKGGNFAAWEHRAVMQVLLFILVGLFSNGVIIGLRKYLEWYGVAIRSRHHDEESLSHMDSLMTECIAALKRHLGSWQKSNFGLVKVHAMSHLSESIRRSGMPWEYSTNMYEQLHISLMKNAYRGSNRRAFNPQIVAYHVRLKAIREKMHDQDPTIGQPVERDTALDLAVATGENVLAGFQFALRPFHIQDPDVVVPKPVSKLLEEQPEIKMCLLDSLNAFLEVDGLRVFKVLVVMGSLAIAAGDGERFGEWPMYVRSSMNFHGRPYFSDVAIQAKHAGEPTETWYGQLRLLFKCETISTLGVKSKQELAFVRMYQGLPFNNLTRLTNCDLYTWKSS